MPICSRIMDHVQHWRAKFFRHHQLQHSVYGASVSVPASRLCGIVAFKRSSCPGTRSAACCVTRNRPSAGAAYPPASTAPAALPSPTSAAKIALLEKVEKLACRPPLNWTHIATKTERSPHGSPEKYSRSPLPAIPHWGTSAPPASSYGGLPPSHQTCTVWPH